MLIFERDMAIDMGTSETLVYAQDSGLVLREPTVVAVDKFSGEMLKTGQEAEKMLGRTPANIVSIHPIQSGVINDYDMTAQMLREYINRNTSFSLFKPRVLMCVPSSISGVEERAICDAVIEAGARKVYLLETAVATAMGAGIDISLPDGHMVIDIGSGTTEVAVISMGGVVECESIKTAGDAFDDSIVRYVRRKYNLIIGQRTAEELKCSIGCVMKRPSDSVDEIKGRDVVTGLPKVIKIHSSELLEVFREPVVSIMEAVHNTLERTPPELVGDLSANGIVMSGGGSLLFGLDQLIERSTGIRTVVVDDAVSCAAYGAGKMLKHLNDMPEGMVNFARKRQLKK
ncbi:MAG: rod shape-determining protein [Oscillospiraceae bacterium]|nr:rod shape-determining protein [Oscillospiraceae bacterium]